MVRYNKITVCNHYYGFYYPVSMQNKWMSNIEETFTSLGQNLANVVLTIDYGLSAL